MSTKVVAAGGLALTVALGVTACGTAQKLSAKQSVQNAFTGLQNAKAAAFTVSLDTTKADLQAISGAEGEKLDANDLKALDNLLAGDVAFTVQAPAGKTLGQAGKATSAKVSPSDPEALAASIKQSGNFSAVAHLNGADLVDLRMVAGVLYARADAAKILQLADEDPAQLDQALAELPPSLRPLAKAAKNQWVSVDLAEAVKAADESGALKNLTPTPSATPTLDAGKLQKLMNDLKAAYDKQVTMTQIGSDGDRGQGYRLGAPAKRIAQSVSDDLVALVGQGSESEIRRGLTAVPDKTFYLDVWVKDDKLSAFSLDLTQFMKKPVNGKKLAVDVAVDTEPDAVTAPGGATPLDVKKIVNDLPSALSSMGGGAVSGSDGPGTGKSSLSGAQEKQAREQLKQAGLSDAEIDRILGT